MQDFAAGKNLHDIYHGWPQAIHSRYLEINRDSRFEGGHQPRIKVNFVQIFAEEEIRNVISILYPKEIWIINGKKCYVS